MNNTEVETSPQDSQTGDEQASQDVSIEHEGERETSLSKDLIFELLKNERRRRVLKFLETQSETTLSALAEDIAARENGIDQGLLTSTQRKRVYIALYQCHLPKLDDADVVEFEQARGTVSLTDRADQLFPYLHLDEQPDEPADSTLSTIVGQAVDRFRSSPD